MTYAVDHRAHREAHNGKRHPLFINPGPPCGLWPGQGGLLGPTDRDTLAACAGNAALLARVVEGALDDEGGLALDFREGMGLWHQLRTLSRALHHQVEVIEAHNESVGDDLEAVGAGD